MSRWILLGLRRGVRTTRFPSKADPAASAPAAVQVDPGRLTPGEARTAAELCPTSALTVEGDERHGSLTFDLSQCILCGRCVRELPHAFRLAEDPRVAVRSRGSLSVRLAWNGDERSATLPTQELATAAAALDRRARRIFGHSLHIRHVDAGSCNGCESELQLLSSPYYDLSRLGFFFTPTPRHADALLVTGVVTRQLEEPLRRTYEAMPEPKLVIAAGVCALGGGSFATSPLMHGPLDQVLPVDVYVPGCPPQPLALLHGLLLAVDRAEERLRVVGGADGA